MSGKVTLVVQVTYGYTEGHFPFAAYAGGYCSLSRHGFRDAKEAVLRKVRRAHQLIIPDPEEVRIEV